MMTGDIVDAPPRRWRWESLTGGGAVFQDDAYRRLWIGRLLSHTGLNAVLYTLLVLAVGEGTGTSIKSALFIAAYLLPTATLGTVSGVLVDRLPKNVVLSGINIVRIGLMLIMLMSDTGLWTVYGVALLLAVTSQFAAPAEAAALPQVVRHDQLTLANSTNNFGGLISQVVGFAVIPPLFLNTVGPRPLFFITMVLFVSSAVFFMSITKLGSHIVGVDHVVEAVKNVRHQFAEAWERLGRDTLAYMSIIISVLASTASLVAVTMMPRYAQVVLDIAVRNSIYVFLPAALGILAGLRLVHWLGRRVSPGWLIGAGFGCLCVSFVLLGMTEPLALLLPFPEQAARIAVAIAGSTAAAFSYSVVAVASRSVVNQRMPVEVQGRIFAAQVVLANLASIPPILFAGLISELVGVAPVMFLTVFLLLTAAGWTLARALSRSEVTRLAEPA